MKFKGFNIEIDEDRIATDQTVYLVKLMEMAKEQGEKEAIKHLGNVSMSHKAIWHEGFEKGKQEMREECIKEIEKWFKDWQGELIGEEPAKSEIIRKLKGLGK